MSLNKKLLYAIDQNLKDEIEECLNNGADPHLLYPIKGYLHSKYYGGSSLISIAVAEQNIDLLTCLIKHKADINKGVIPEIVTHNRQIVSILINNGVDLNYLYSICKVSRDKVIIDTIQKAKKKNC